MEQGEDLSAEQLVVIKAAVKNDKIAIGIPCDNLSL